MRHRASTGPWLLAPVLLTAAGCRHAASPGYQPAPPPIHAANPDRTTPPPPSQSAGADQTLGMPVSTELGLASWYGPPYHNHQAADGSIFDQNAMTAAHRTLPLGTTVRVTNLQTNEAVVVRITDRGPFVPNRVLDLSLAAAKAAGVYQAGVVRVRIEAFPYAASDPAGKWCVQIGSFLTLPDAVQVKNDLARRYASAKVIAFQGPTGFWVRINPTVPNRANATEILDSIHVPDADPYLVRTD